VEYKSILEEVENILMEAGFDEEEMKKSAAAGGKNHVGQSCKWWERDIKLLA
jgi:hypothetical protein